MIATVIATLGDLLNLNTIRRDRKRTLKISFLKRFLMYIGSGKFKRLMYTIRKIVKTPETVGLLMISRVIYSILYPNKNIICFFIYPRLKNEYKMFLKYIVRY